MKKIEDLFEHKTKHIAGKLTSENEFMAYDKWVVIGWNMPNLKRKAAYLTGKITKSETGSLIKLEVKPNSILPIFAILSAVLGVVLTVKAYSSTEDNKFLWIFGLAFIVLGIIYYPMSTFLKNRLRNKIVQHLDLSRI